MLKRRDHVDYYLPTEYVRIKLNSDTEAEYSLGINTVLYKQNKHYHKGPSDLVA